SLEPAGRVTPRRIAMRPMEDAALLVPDIFAAKLDDVAASQRLDAASQIDVMRDEDGEAVDIHQEALMSRALSVIAKQLRHSASARNRNVTGMCPPGFHNREDSLIASE